MGIIKPSSQDQHFMQAALKLAAHARNQNEVPVGAVLVLDQQIIGQGWNQPITTQDPTAHAEIMALRAAGQYQNNYRLLETTLYVTLEPCVMCVGAMIHARIKRLVFGALDPKTGAVKSVFQLLDTQKFNHNIIWTGECEAVSCGELLREFFKKRR